jgi:hypothetical protein
MTTTYTYAFTDGSQINVTYDETSAQTVNPPNGYAVTAISGTWQGSTIYSVNGDTGNYVNDASGLSYYDNTIFPNFGPTGDGANSLGNLDGIDTAGLLFQMTDANGPLVQLYWDGSDLTSLAWTSVQVDSTPNGSGSATLSGFTACYAAGTRILTANGEIPVEQLREGDSVVTMTSFGLSRIRWIGMRRVDVARHPRRFDVAPVRVRAHAFAEDRPHRDLLLSPDHAVFVDGVLIPARYLVNGATVVQDMTESVTYYHVELGRHDVILAEGLPAESYLDTGNRAAFANGGTTIHAHPDFARRVWQARSCAPLITGGAVLEGARAALLARAKTLGHTRVNDPGLRLLADGRPQPIAREGSRIVANLPAGTRYVRLESRSAVPAWTLPGSTDHRSLGVAVRDIRLDGAALEAAAFGAGWHRPEPGLRWTDGGASLRIGGGELTITLLPLLWYWDSHPETAPHRAAA